MNNRLSSIIQLNKKGKPKMNIYKKLTISLVLFNVLFTGCSYENSKTSTRINEDNESTVKNISNIESEIYTALKKSNGSSYRLILGEATSDKEIAVYDNVNLLSVKVIHDSNEYKIKLFYDESLLKVSIIEDFLEPVYATAYHLAEKNKIVNSVVVIYVNNKLLREF